MKKLNEKDWKILGGGRELHGFIDCVDSISTAD
jgi:hypothetical protein